MQQKEITVIHSKYVTSQGLDNDSALDRLERFKEISYMAERPFFSMDLLRLTLGDKIGEGAYRAVYNFEFKKNTVIKVASDERANVIEYHIWRACSKIPYQKKWLAPCYYISPCGHFLVQHKVRPLTDKDKLPKELPSFFSDIKKGNWGFIGKRLVCHDYQFLSRLVDLSFNAGKRKAEWK
jgi:hypothetical protein